MIRRIPLGLTLALAACPGEGVATTDEASTGGSTTAPTTATATTDTTDTPTTGAGACAADVSDCCCFEIDESDELSWSVEQRCASAGSCPDINILCGDVYGPGVDCPGDELMVLTPTYVSCALIRLKDSEPGSIRWHITADGAEGYWEEETELFVTADRTAFVIEREHLDAGNTYQDVRKIPLPAAEILETCLGEDDLAQFECLRTALVAPPETECIPGFYNDGQR